MENKKHNWLLPLLVALAAIVLIGFTWWTISIPTTPNLSTRFPTVHLTDPVRGGQDAQVTIVEYSDFQCEFCQTWHTVAQQILDKYGDKVRLVWKDFPLTDLHPEAKAAAEAARCAQQQFAFWEYHDQLFARQSELGTALYTDIAQDLGLDAQAFTRCRGSGDADTFITQSQQEGVTLGVSGTPTIYVGQYIFKEAPSFSTVDSLVSSLLSE